MASNLCAKLEADRSRQGDSMGHRNLLASSFERRGYCDNYIFATDSSYFHGTSHVTRSLSASRKSLIEGFLIIIFLND